MSNTVFPFTISRPYREHRLTLTAGADLGGGINIREAEIDEAPGWMFRAMFDLRLPRDGQTVDDYDDWIENREGAKDTFLFKASRTQNKTVTDEAVGTGDGSETVFTLDKKHIDSSTLVVKVNGATQTGGGTDYTFSLNNTTPTITFTSPPTNTHPITASYEFYFPVWFETDPPEAELLSGGSTSATIPHIVRGVVVVEQYPGAHLV